MNENNDKNITRFFGLLFLLASLGGIFAVFYEMLQPWWKENSNYLIGIFISVPLSVHLERSGIFLQFLAGISIIPELIGETKLHESELFLKNFYSQIRRTHPLLPVVDNGGKYVSSKLERRFVLITTLLWVVAILIMWVYPIFSSQPQYANMLEGWYSCFMIMILATGIGTGRLMAETLVFIVHGITAWSVKMLPIKRLVSFVSFPLFLIGTLMQLAATFIA